jgi:hypothetical protein
LRISAVCSELGLLFPSMPFLILSIITFPLIQCPPLSTDRCNIKYL